MPSIHRNKTAQSDLWRAVAGQIRSAMHAHPDIHIPAARLDSIVKRVVGQVLALAARPVTPGEPCAVQFLDAHICDNGEVVEGGASAPPELTIKG